MTLDDEMYTQITPHLDLNPKKGINQRRRGIFVKSWEEREHLLLYKLGKLVEPGSSLN